MPKITAREYKVMLDHKAFADRNSAVAAFGEEFELLTRSLGLESKGKFEIAEKRTIVFFDTLDHSFHRSSLVLRQRTSDEGDAVELTVKAMSSDRFIAGNLDVRSADGTDGEPKFEEDIGILFRSRFAHSTTVETRAKKGLDVESATVADAAAFFPILGKVKRDGVALPKDVPLRPVNGVRAFETVFKGPKLFFGGERKATIAVILWAERPKGRPLVAEFSFRYKVEDDDVPPSLASEAFTLFERLQRMDWCHLKGMTKTQYVYRTTANE